MQPIRVVLAEMPRMLRDIVHGVLAAQPDVALSSVAAADALADAVTRLDADVAILAESAPPADDHAALLYAHPHLRLVGISSDGRAGHLYELRPHRVALGALSPESLVEAVRATPNVTARATARARTS